MAIGKSVIAKGDANAIVRALFVHKEKEIQNIYSRTRFNCDQLIGFIV